MESITLFLAASLALIITPGPDLLYVLTRGISGGRVSGVLSALGVTCGILVHTLAAALGLAVLLKTSTLLFWAVKIAGGVYLLFLGLQMVRNGNDLDLELPQTTLDRKKCFFQGFLSNVLDPKVALFFIAFLPQFVAKESTSHSHQMIFLGLVFALLTVLFLAALGLFSGSIGTWLRKRKQVARKINIGSGGLLMLLGLRLLIPQK